MSSPTFAESFCAQNQIHPEQFAREVFKRSLYRRARWVSWLLPLIWRGYFAADFDLIYGVERLRRVRAFAVEADRFNDHPANRGFLRRTLGLRVSTCRLRALVREALPRSEECAAPVSATRTGTIVPFEIEAQLPAGCPGGLSERNRPQRRKPAPTFPAAAKSRVQWNAFAGVSSMEPTLTYQACTEYSAGVTFAEPMRESAGA